MATVYPSTGPFTRLKFGEKVKEVRPTNIDIRGRVSMTLPFLLASN
jgi:hypothetical protein